MIIKKYIFENLNISNNYFSIIDYTKNTKCTIEKLNECY